MTEEEVRLALLQTEINSIQNAVRGFDATSIQVKGWCVTASLAIGGFAAAYHKPQLLIVGVGSALAFYLVNCQFNMIQRKFLIRIAAIDAELRDVGIMQVLQGGGGLNITGAGGTAYDQSESSSVAERIRSNLSGFYFEASRVSLFTLYAFVILCLLIELIILLS